MEIKKQRYLEIPTPLNWKTLEYMVEFTIKFPLLAPKICYYRCCCLSFSAATSIK